MNTALLAGLLAAPLLLGPSLEEVELGPHGAVLELSKEWSRAQISPDLGDNQFLGRGSMKDFFLVVAEMPGLYTERQDVEAILEPTVAGIERVMQDSRSDGVQYEERGKIHHAWSVIRGKIGGTQLVYEIHYLGRDSLAVQIMAWCPPSRGAALRRAIDGIVGSVRFPSDGSPWDVSNRPIERTLRVRGHEVGFQYRPSLFHASEASEALCLYTTQAEEVVLAVLLAEGHSSADESLDEVLTILQETWPDLDEKARSDARVGERHGRRASLRGPESNVNAEILAVELAPGAYLDARFLYQGHPDGRRELEREFLDSLRVDALPSVDAFPDAVEDVEPAYLTADQRAFLERCEHLADFHGDPEDSELQPDGRVLVATSESVELFDPRGGSSDVLYRGDWVQGRQAALQRDQLFVLVDDGTVRRVRRGRAEDEGFPASAMTLSEGGGFHLLREAAPAQVEGLAGLGPSEEPRLIRREHGGQEEVLATFPGKDVHALAVDEKAGRALVVLNDRAGPAYPRALAEVALKTAGKVRDFSGWSVERITESAAGGWLIHGCPPGGTYGVYDASGREPVLLLSGVGSHPVAWDGKRLLFFGPVDYRSDGPVARLYACDAGPLRELGPRYAPFGAGLLQELGVEAVRRAKIDPRSPGLLADRKDVRALFEAAGKACAERHGLALPSEPEAVEQILMDLTRTSAAGLGREGILLLVALFSEALIGEGAEWVDGETSSLGSLRPAPGSWRDELLVVRRDPAADVHESLFGEGWALPAGLLATADGRAMLIGTDPDALQRAFDERREPGVDDVLRRGSERELSKLLAEHPGNAHLRAAVYAELARQARFDELGRLAAAYVPQGEVRDAEAALAARVATRAAEEMPRLIDDLHELIRGHPARAPGYVMLGRVYEESGALDEALACYEKVLELTSWDDNARLAEAGLARLEEGAR